MDKLDAMSVLVATADAGSFSAAGRALGMPLASVSRKIGDLERHLGTRLFIRSTRKLALTEAGAAYLAASRRILDLAREAEAQALGEYAEPRGELIVTAPVAFGRMHVLPLLTAFLALHPRIDVRMVLADRNLDLVDQHVDVAVRIGELPDSTLVAVRLGAVRRVVCAAPAYLAAHGSPTGPEQLADHSAVTFLGGSAGREWILPGPDGRPLKATPRSRLHVDTAEAAIDAAVAGIGLTQILSYQAAAALAAGTLVEVLAAFGGDLLPVHILHPGQGPMPLKTRRFLDYAVPRLRTVLGR